MHFITNQRDFNVITVNFNFQLKAVILNVRGLDTFATVYFNEQVILETNNQFVSHIVKLKEWKVGTNKIKIYFVSPVKRASALHHQYMVFSLSIFLIVSLANLSNWTDFARK